MCKAILGSPQSPVDIQAKEIHQRIITIDTHVDAPMYFGYGADIGKTNPVMKVDPNTVGMTDKPGNTPYLLKVDIPQMIKGQLDAAVMVAYLHQEARTKAASQEAVKKADAILNKLTKQIQQHSDIVGQARNSDDIRRLKKEGKKAIVLGIENGYAIGKDLKNVQKYADKGVAYITLSHNGDNDICDAAVRSKQEHNGLSEFGRQVVREMNRCGIIVDVSHTSEKTALDVVELSAVPVIASHSACKGLCDHPRNISDRAMKAIADKGGVIQVCFYEYFVKKNGKATLKDAVNHIDYIVKKVGIDHVGIGTDMDGGTELPDMQNATDYPKITVELLKRGYSEEDIAKIWGGNFLRVWDAVQKAKK
ncbi:MAG: dipeptidase [Dysgonamonadaceae bacterium]|jgi:microsomal dipeptidase-like Zn-dependent dipeptidase|nr:dipeptidase [Dysgonamonadaceae bacterium]